MEVKNENSALLSNMEVLRLLEDVQHGRNHQLKPDKHLQNLATITYETVKYLKTTPCTYQQPHDVAMFMMAVEREKLSKAEKLQMVNMRPTTVMEFCLCVDENEDRFPDESKIAELLSIVQEHLPGPEVGSDGTDSVNQA